ncbi:hypothetical protein VD0002_g937 [Verticillium dahliae]|uniref:Uncharacterized protein n=2 Tax=Verticillium dahliae TaxID=27337 RepID=G2X0P9_VERDV|nr:uncharacterized protein VDAG_03828 [Verticillium dahliae VdLs.17]KAF3343887.1 L-amino-acid oxidase [Verticillium dahliae VDG2]KAH6704795.1 hypothetical protein EV126DRAFT_196809 [Verticillium dahliae]EGY22390.1 hypothetical protein VDAG_03828 [Verticillium dahliae VdLs.17]PNH33631.1 hypothetical protein BJF96_g3075 [Verticillium dahliae]PNH45707.1 hypothetical protein VD0004_g2241 [Verticillium dahliae]
MADPAPPRRRFVPVPIETTFQSVRSQAPKTQPGGHTDELTPEPSPRDQSPDPVVFQPGKRRFAPQLIETSRRTRRVGDTGPATKPADKTDITPYTNHIYVQRNKSRRKPHDQSSHNQTVLHKGARRESEDENAGNYVLEWAAKEAERQMHEDALAAFPNSRAREGGAAHFYFRESSGDDSLSSSTSPVPLREQPKALHGRQPRAARRKSSDLGYWHKHMQEHAEKVAAERGDTMHDVDADGDLDGDVDMDDSELDNMVLDSPPDPMWTTDSRKRSQPGAARGPIGETYMPLVGSTTTVLQETKTAQVGPAGASSSSATGRPIGESHMPLVPPSVSGIPATSRPAHLPFVKPSQIPPETGFRNVAGGFVPRPFGRAAQEDANLRRMRSAASPPMLGKELTFRRCPSPKLTKLEPNHPFKEVEFMEDINRDATGGGGLWRGYCYKDSRNSTNIVQAELQPPTVMRTPMPSTPGDPFAQAFGRGSMSDEPESSSQSSPPAPPEHRLRSGEAKGLHMLHGLEEKLKREKANVEREDRIHSEFNDAFITQVYNYLSLGYPAMARNFDQELSKFAKVSIADLRVDDASQMAHGHVVEAAQVPEDRRCPRWRALKVYILEWAHQHPNLDTLDPLAWGVRERRGSWAI